MANLYIEKGDNATVNPSLGYALLNHNVEITEINEDIVIQAEKPFLYYNKRYLKALNTGVIDQSLYDAITNEETGQGAIREVVEYSTNIDVSKESLVTLVNNYSIQNVNTDGTATQILSEIILEGYQVIKKI